MNEKPILVTSPLLPPLENFIPYLEDIWKNKWITNNGAYHQKLEKALCEYLEIPYLSLFTNGTLPLITAFQALQITGEVITTPYSFVATTHALWWNGIKPVFVDVDPLTGNMDPDKIKAAMTTKTTAIMPVHVYGNPCDVSNIKKIADTYGLKVIYDAAHAFGVKVNGKSILEHGDISTLSFHATKVYNTIEGGALICHSAEDKQRIDYLKNFGFADEVTVVSPGINSKMDEIRAAYGLLNLKQVDDAIKSRQRTAQLYREGLRDVPGIRYIDEIQNIQYNYSYFPIFVDKDAYRMNRDDLYAKLKSKNIYGRRYFYPLISAFSPYRSLESATESNLPIAHKLAESVICLPMSAGLPDEDVERVIESIKK
jgi:dTDP-4-amino-4,6-dideoxygalactose transaminase